MRFYEIIFILRPDIQQDSQSRGENRSVSSKIDPFIKIVEENGGSLKLKEEWGLRNLAYEVRKNKKGYYVMIVIEANSDVVEQIEGKCKLSEDVIRYLTVRVDQPSTEPSPIMKDKLEEKAE